MKIILAVFFLLGIWSQTLSTAFILPQAKKFMNELEQPESEEISSTNNKSINNNKKLHQASHLDLRRWKTVGFYLL